MKQNLLPLAYIAALAAICNASYVSHRGLDSDEFLPKSPQNLFFEAKELSTERGGNLRFIVSVDYEHRQNIFTVQTFEMSCISYRQLLPYIGMVVVEVDKNAKMDHAVNAVRALQSIPGTTVEADSVIGIFEELSELPIKDKVDGAGLRGGEGIEPRDELWDDSWGLRDINAPEAWKYLSLHRSSDEKYRPKVAILGSGVDYNHEDLRANMWANEKENTGQDGVDDDANGYIDDVRGWNTITQKGDPMDDVGHGTHLAGIIGATANNEIGSTGIAWNVHLIPCKFINSQRWGFLSDAVICIDYSLASGADIIVATWGVNKLIASSFILPWAIKVAQREANVIYVAPSGSEGEDVSRNKFYTALAEIPCVISVGALNSSNQLLRESNFSGKVIDIVAPGEGIKSLSRKGLKHYTFGQGTSMSAAYIAGVAAMMKTLQPSAGCAKIEQSIASSAVQFKDSMKALKWGGKVDAVAALEILQSKS